ncbi:hypothetical protein ACFVVA_41985 [Kitasatospora sp. NPDC058048]
MLPEVGHAPPRRPTPAEVALLAREIAHRHPDELARAVGRYLRTHGREPW